MGNCFSDVNGGKQAVGVYPGSQTGVGGGGGGNDAVEFFFRNRGMTSLSTQIEVHAFDGSKVVNNQRPRKTLIWTFVVCFKFSYSPLTLLIFFIKFMDNVVILSCHPCM